MLDEMMRLDVCDWAGTMCREQDFNQIPFSTDLVRIMFSFTTNPTISITLNGQQSRLRKTIKVQGGEPIELPVYSGQELVSGTVDISVPPGKKIEHQGVRIEMIGQTGAPFSL